MSEKAARDYEDPADDARDETDDASDEDVFGDGAGLDDPDYDDEDFDDLDVDDPDLDDLDLDDPDPDDPDYDDAEDDLDVEDMVGALDVQAELDELNDRHLRLAAEFNNFRRRHETQMTEAWARAQADLLGRLVDVLDDLQRVSLLDPSDDAVTVESIVEGIDLVERKFVRTLADAGVEVVDPAEGDPFDPERMEAMMRVDDDSGDRDDQVAAVFQKGYVLKGNLVRPARVSVYKG